MVPSKILALSPIEYLIGTSKGSKGLEAFLVFSSLEALYYGV